MSDIEFVGKEVPSVWIGDGERPKGSELMEGWITVNGVPMEEFTGLRRELEERMEMIKRCGLRI